MPPLRSEHIALAEPPEIVATGIRQTAERQLCPLPRRSVLGHERHQRFERLEVPARWHAAQAVIQRMMAERAHRPIAGGEHFIEIQVVPGPVVEHRNAFTGGP